MVTPHNQCSDCEGLIPVYWINQQAVYVLDETELWAGIENRKVLLPGDSGHSTPRAYSCDNLCHEVASYIEYRKRLQRADI